MSQLSLSSRSTALTLEILNESPDDLHFSVSLHTFELNTAKVETCNALNSLWFLDVMGDIVHVGSWMKGMWEQNSFSLPFYICNQSLGKRKTSKNTKKLAI